ncbi:MAG: DNA polymerase IV [Bacteroidetes bacterium]|nr:DNA polymerase IV [Bacteroidota bacterium]
MVLAPAADRAILHLDLDAFFVSVEVLRDSRLKGRPLIVGGKGGRGVVAACSYEARRFGVHSAMPMKLAMRLCPNALVISGDMEAYSKYSRLVTDIIADHAPLFEKSSIDEFYLDLSGMDRFHGSYGWASDLRKTITAETGLPISFGLSVNKMVSKVATNEAKPNGQLLVPRGTEREFIAPMSIGKLPMVGEKTFRFLRGMGIAQVQTLREMPLELLEQLMGKSGGELWRRANAIDDSPVVPHTEAKSLSTERTFQQDTMDIRFLKSLLVTMVEKLAFKLREQQKLTGCLTVKIRYSSFDTVSRQAHLTYTAADHVLLHKAEELFDKLYDRRLLIRLLGVRLSDLVQGHQQIDLFDDTPEYIRLYQAMDRMRSKHGANKLMRAVGLGLVSARPDFNPFAKV